MKRFLSRRQRSRIHAKHTLLPLDHQRPLTLKPRPIKQKVDRSNLSPDHTSARIPIEQPI
jgi:hypothetical protein